MEKLIVSTSPHMKHRDTTQRIMLDMLIALLPATIMAMIFYGLRALLIVTVCVTAAVGSEYIFNLITKKSQTVNDFSAAVTGLLLGLNLPLTATVWQCIVGSVFAIIVVKCLFGGIGCNFANPAITARIFLLICFAGSIGGGVAPNMGDLTEQIVAGATPLAMMKEGNTDALPSLFEMLFGLRGGAIGEGCIVALLLGFVYLLVRKVISWHTPVVFIGTVFLLSLLTQGSFELALYQILSGGLVLGAVFMATDYSTTPINKWGKVVFAFGCGVLTVVIRYFSPNPEGISYAILIMNILSPYIEKWCAPKPFGKVGKKIEEK